MSALVSPTENQFAILTALQAGIFKTALATTMFRLFKNDIVPGPGTVFADFTEADFTGYGAIGAAAWLAPGLDPVANRWRLTTGAFSFTQSGTTITNTVYGWYLDDGSGVTLAAGRFDTPIEMDTSGKDIWLTPFIFASGFDGPDPYED